MHMKRICSLVGLGAMLTVGTTALAADPPATADVLGKLHDANRAEIALGKMAEKDGKSKDVTKYGKMLVKDHTSADKKVMALAKKEKIELPAGPAEKETKDDEAALPSGDGFDAAFAKMMVTNHEKDIADLTQARDATNDDKLKKLLSDVLPTLHKHEDAAKKLVDETTKK